MTDAITDSPAKVQPENAIFIELLPLMKVNLPKKLADFPGALVVTSVLKSVLLTFR